MSHLCHHLAVYMETPHDNQQVVDNYMPTHLSVSLAQMGFSVAEGPQIMNLMFPCQGICLSSFFEEVEKQVLKPLQMPGKGCQGQLVNNIPQTAFWKDSCGEIKQTSSVFSFT